MVSDSLVCPPSPYALFLRRSNRLAEALRKPALLPKADWRNPEAGWHRPSLLPQHQLGDGRQLHVGRALVDLADLGVTPVFLDGIILGKSIPTVDFNGQ